MNTLAGGATVMLGLLFMLVLFAGDALCESGEA